MPRALAADAVAPTLAAALVRSSTDATAAEIERVSASVTASIGAMPDTLRLGVRAAELASDVVLRVLGRGDFRRQPAAVQSDLAERLAALPFPAIPELVRLTRGLGLASLYEGRAEAEDGHEVDAQG